MRPADGECAHKLNPDRMAHGLKMVVGRSESGQRRAKNKLAVSCHGGTIALGYN
jgi:hypothetical protein